MGLKEYITPLLKWWWLLLAATFLAAVSSFLLVNHLPQVYQAHATLMIGTVIEDPNPNGNELNLAQQLAAAYADICNRSPVKNRTMQALGLSFMPETLCKTAPNSSFIDVAVTDTDPERAQSVANELAHQLILSSPGGADTTSDERQQFVNEQLDGLQAQIRQTNADLAKLKEQLGGLSDASQISDTQAQITAQQYKLAALQANYANLLATAQKGATNTLSLLEPAVLPTVPIGPKIPLTVGLASVIGLTLAALAALGMETLDDTLKSADEIEHLVNVPILGYIGEISRNDEGSVYIANHPLSIIAEAFRSLRTNLDFAGVERPIKTLLVTSASPGDGKTLVSSNLAVTMAQGGKKVILLDTDLRHPDIHTSFSLENSNGLSDLLLGTVDIDRAVHSNSEENLGVVTAGTPPPNPAELIGSKKMDGILASLPRADITILDTAPFLVADAWLLAAKVDAVLLVIRPGYTSRSAVRSMLQQIKRSGARVVGVALNRIPRQRQEYYVGSLRSYYGPADQGEAPAIPAGRVNARQGNAWLEPFNAIRHRLSAGWPRRNLGKGNSQLTNVPASKLEPTNTNTGSLPLSAESARELLGMDGHKVGEAGVKDLG